MDRSVIADIPRDKYVERCKQRAFDYLDRGDLKSAVSSFVNNMDARPDCELPHHLAELGVVLWMSKDVQGWKALIEGIKYKGNMISDVSLSGTRSHIDRATRVLRAPI